MKSLNSPQSEFELKYDGTIMQVKHKLLGTGGLCAVGSTLGDVGWPFIHVVTKGPMVTLPVLKAYDYPIYDLSVKRFLPEGGYYNTSTMAIYLRRKATKQWKNSLCSSIYSAFNAWGYANGDEDSKLSLLSSKILQSLVHPIYYSIGEAADRLTHSKKSCAVSDSICLVRGTNKKILVVYSSYTIGEYIRGTVKNKGYVIPFINSPAISNLLKNHNIPMKENL